MATSAAPSDASSKREASAPPPFPANAESSSAAPRRAVRLRWLTNLNTLSRAAALQDDRVEVAQLGSGGLSEALRLFRRSQSCDVILLYQPPGLLTWALCALRLVAPWRQPKLALIDVVLTKPGAGPVESLKRRLKRTLFRAVDLFIAYMRYLPALEEHYGIGADRHAFVPFKANECARRWGQAEAVTGDYVFTGGRSRRDFGSFCQAMGRLDLPAVIVTPRAQEGAYHETYLDPSSLPPNVRVVHDDGTQDSWARWIHGARLVVLCISDDSISPSGVGAYLEAMAIGKCVIITECPATHGVLADRDQALLVERGDVAGLAAAIDEAWRDDALRDAIAKRGQAYAASLGAEPELVERCARAVLERLA